MANIADFILLKDHNVFVVVVGTVLLGICCACIGTFTFLRKRSLISDAVAHSVLPGICMSFILLQEKNPWFILIGAFISGWLSILTLNYLVNNTKLKSDTATGLVLSFFFGLGILLLSYIQNSGNASQAGLKEYLVGKGASMTSSDLNLFVIVTIISISIILIFFKAFKLISFNRDYARSIGLNVTFYEVILSSLTVLAITVGVQAVGVVLMAALLTTPATTARLWTNNLSKLMVFAVLICASAAYIGSYISYSNNAMPTGPWIVIILSFLTLLSIIFSPSRGILAKLKRSKNNKQKILTENILKAFYYLGEEKEDYKQARTQEDIQNNRSFIPKNLSNGLTILAKRTHLVRVNNNWTITDKGLEEAKRVVRLHRLWEMYLNKKLNIPADHVHPDAEAIEHIITPEIEKLLLKELNNPLVDPHNKIIPS